jgi:hypothetical protein
MMKKYIVCILLLCLAFPLFAQSNTASIFVLPVTGTGSRAEDNAFFFKQLGSEVKDLHFNLAKTLQDAEFYLVSTLYPNPDGAGNDPDSPVRQYVFHLTLLENKTDKARAEGELLYETTRNIGDMFSNLVYTVLHTIPASTGRNNWRNKWVYIGGSVFWTPRIYTADSAATYLTNFGGGIFAELHFLNFLSLGAGAELASDMVKVLPSDTETYGNTLLEIPLLLKIVFKPGDFALFEPYGGVHFNIPFENTTVPPQVSWLVGFQFGIKAGPGVLYIDPRFSMDIGKSILDEEASGVSDLLFQRNIIHLGIGYKVGFFTRR